jgi:PTH1 family peptidyl-tRNA hydrolase
MKCIIGLGNPGSPYERTRHNVGYRVLDAFADSVSASWQRKASYRASIAEYSHQGEKILLIKPEAFYNLNGEVVRAITHFYKVAPEDVLVIHDELALPSGTIRTRIGGSDAGNNGVKSITSHVGEGTARIRVGIAMTLCETMQDDAEYVLGTMSLDELKVLADAQPAIERSIDDFISGRFEHTTHR